MKKVTMLIAAVAAQMLCASPIPEFPFIASSGEAEKSVAPDQVVISFMVLSHQKAAEAAMTEVNQGLRNLVVKLAKLNVKADQIIAADLEKRAVRKQEDEGKKTQILGYDVSRRVSVELDDLTQYSEIVGLIFGANNITQVSSEFGSSDEKKLMSDLVALACQVAREKGENLAKASGVQIERIYAVSDGQYGGFDFQFGIGGRYLGSDPFGILSSPQDNSPPLFVPKEISFRRSVDILFKLVE